MVMLRSDYKPILTMISFITLIPLMLSSCLCEETGKPNIVFIIADDMGRNDVSFHGSNQIQTPNIDSLAYDGTVLTNYYSEAICTPTRSALLTGQYPIRTGMQGFPLYNAEDRALPLKTKLLPTYLKEQGYATHAVGKWHVGMARPEHLPLRRGFDSHFGFHGGFVDYYEYNKFETWPNGKAVTGYDMFRNNRPEYGVQGYMTDVLTNEAISIIENANDSVPLFLYLSHGAPHAGNDGALLQAPPEAVRANGHIADTNRRSYAAMVTKLDHSIGELMNALDRKKMLSNTIIIFMSDNGAPSVGMYNNWGSNLPFRGIKATPWEGGVKVPALVWHKSLKGSKAWPGLMHVTDWPPTLLRAVNGEIPEGIDGVDQWEGIAYNAESNRNEVLVMMDDFSDLYSYRLGNHKLVVGKLGSAFNDYYTENLMEEVYPPTPYLQTLEQSTTYKVLKKNGRKINLSKVEKLRSQYSVRQIETRKRDRLCVPDVFKPCLYNVKNDPKEQYDIAMENPQIVKKILNRLLHYFGEMVPRGPLNIYERANPNNFNYTWIPWLEDHI